MSPVAAPVEDLFELDLELVQEATDIDAEKTFRCFSRPSCCGTRSLRSIDLD